MSSYKHKSGAAKRKERGKKEQENAKLLKLDAYLVRPHGNGNEPDDVGSKSDPPPIQQSGSGSQTDR